MSRSEIPQDLIFDVGQEEQDGKLADALCQIALDGVEPVVRDALTAATASAVADDWVDHAVGFITHLTKTTEHFRDFNVDQLRTKLSDRIQEHRRELGDAPPAQEATIQAEAAELVQILMGTWVDLLDAAVRSSLCGAALIGQDLMPEDLSAADQDRWRSIFKPYCIDGHQQLTLTKSVYRQLEAKQPMELPLGLRLDRTPRGLRVSKQSAPE